MVFTKTLPIAPIGLVVLPLRGCLSLGLYQGAFGTGFCLVFYLELFLAQLHLDCILVFDHPLADVNLLLYRAVTRWFPQSWLPSARPGVVLYLHLFAPHVLFDDLPLVDDVFAHADLLFRHRLFLDNDLFLDHRHG